MSAPARRSAPSPSRSGLSLHRRIRVAPEPPGAPWNRRPPRGHAAAIPAFGRAVDQGWLEGRAAPTHGGRINVPIRSVLITSLVKFDGRRMRVLRARSSIRSPAARAVRASTRAAGGWWCRPRSTRSRTSGCWPRPGRPEEASPDHAQEGAGGHSELEPQHVRQGGRRPNRRSSSPASTSTTRWCSTWHTAPRGWSRRCCSC